RTEIPSLSTIGQKESVKLSFCLPLREMWDSKGFSGPYLAKLGENPGSRIFWSEGEKKVLDRIALSACHA
ncbi:hypothetical protein ACI3PL_24320, partial [Lacticaseibacillus paracasei]